MNEMRNSLSVRDVWQHDQVILLDGAMGTELNRRGVDTGLPLWSAAALDLAPHIIREIHRDYVDAGSKVITANTFRTTPFTYRKTGLDESEACRRAREAALLAVSLAIDASGAEALVAGSLAPVADCYTPADYPGRSIAENTYTELASWLHAAGADLLLLETHITFEEVQCALEAARQTGLPLWVSFLIDKEMCLWDGTPLRKAVTLAENKGAQAVLVNCVTLDIARKGVEQLGKVTSLPFGIYANAGITQPSVDGTIRDHVEDAAFAEAVQEWVAAGAHIVGGCCGTTPATIAALKSALYS
jgi:homocysteine S-methyltransferase